MTHLWDRLDEAKLHLTPVQSKYRVLFEDSQDEPAKVLVPDPNWMAAALAGSILPPIDTYLRDRDVPDGQPKEHPYAEPIGPMTEEEAIEYLIMKEIPESVWREWDTGNKPKMVICRKEQLPSSREWRSTWKITEDLNTTDLAA